MERSGSLERLSQTGQEWWALFVYIGPWGWVRYRPVKTGFLGGRLYGGLVTVRVAMVGTRCGWERYFTLSVRISGFQAAMIRLLLAHVYCSEAGDQLC